MEIKRSIEIAVEKTRRFVIRQPETDAMILCPKCNEPMLAAEASAVLFQINCRRVYQLVEAGAAHFVETETGALLVCPPSLDAAIGNIDDAPPVEIVNLLADSAENPSREIKIKGKVL
jgi:hypothetical protein